MLEKKNFVDVLELMEKYHQIREKISIESKLHDKTLETLQEKMSKQFGKIISMDGIKVIIDDESWVLVRKSNTEDIIRISAESNNAEKVKTIVQQTRDLVKQSYDQVK
ncbi:phosphoglucomutase/phosphomannomutase [archaeon MnTg01]|nr:phosphoglucomutase/phosphomannomutase [archaeon MnTg01]